MANEDISNYLKFGIKSGKQISELRVDLISNGWDKHEIDLAIFEFLKLNPDLIKKTSTIKNDSKDIKDIFNLEDIEVKTPSVVHEEVILKPKAIIQKKIFFKKLMIVIALILFLLLLFMFFNNKIEHKKDFIDISNGTVIQFLKNKIDIKINNSIKPFIITGVDEYIVHYYFDGVKGDLALKEEIKINLNESKINNITLRLDKIDDKIPYIYMKL